ncbi:MAG: class I SAM-dependent methyltransferase [Phycisphaerae bacterium]|nr:class I SAM-dependent methyltransferase [Phycisphaerae bacterium]
MIVTERQHRERTHFDRVYRRAERTQHLRIPPHDLRRYGRCDDWRTYGKECAFHYLKPLAGRELLEIGCGTGVDSVLLAANGARVFAYDVSPEAVEIARKRAEVNGLADRITFVVACDLSAAFAGRRFDRVFGNTVLHHLDLTGFSEKVRRVLRPEGVAVFREPVVLDRWLRRLRRCIPWYPSNPSPDERPLDRQDVAALCRGFAGVELRQFECLSRIWPLLRSSWLIDCLHRWDRELLEGVPWSRRFASVLVMRLTGHCPSARETP